MAGDSRRSERVAAAIREEVATFLRVGAKDPRLKGFVTVTAVEVTRDLRHANVFVSVRGSDADTAETFEGLRSVAAHLRSMLGKSLGLRNAPEVHFKADQSVAYAGRIEELLAQVREETPPAPAPVDSTEPGSDAVTDVDVVADTGDDAVTDADHDAVTDAGSNDASDTADGA